MRHVYFRFILGIVFMICMVYSIAMANFAFAVLYLALGGVLLLSAFLMWKKHKGDRR